jgi:anti-anti-sigma regulatory factor
VTTLTLKGVVDYDVAALFLEELAGLGLMDAPVTIDMREAELEDATLIGALVDQIRQAAARAGRIQLLEPPQVLAHNLYRVGALEGDSTIQLVDPRDEIARSS